MCDAARARARAPEDAPDTAGTSLRHVGRFSGRHHGGGTDMRPPRARDTPAQWAAWGRDMLRTLREPHGATRVRETGSAMHAHGSRGQSRGHIPAIRSPRGPSPLAAWLRGVGPTPPAPATARAAAPGGVDRVARWRCAATGAPNHFGDGARSRVVATARMSRHGRCRVARGQGAVSLAP